MALQLKQSIKLYKMISEHNIRPIRRGDTFVFPLEFYEDECEETPIDVSTYVFKLQAKNSAGTTIFTWNNADFVQIATNKCKFQLVIRVLERCIKSTFLGKTPSQFDGELP